MIRRYIMDFSDEEIAEITEAMNSHVSEEKIKDCLKLPPEKLRLTATQKRSLTCSIFILQTNGLQKKEKIFYVIS